jgi:transcription antitermination factor NusG
MSEFNKQRKIDGWCILRTSGRGTLRLTRQLAGAGIEAWTPAKPDDRRTPRTKTRRETHVPLMPSFVFAKAAHIGALLDLSHRPGKIEAFTVFRHGHGVPVIADRELESLRRIAERAERAAQRAAMRGARPPVFRAGQSVRADDGAWAGMTGTVEGVEGKMVRVCFGGRIEAKISAFILQPDESYSVPQQRAA